MRLLRVDHVQLAMPYGGEVKARPCYEELLEIPECPKPSHLAVRGGCWFENGSLKIHLGVDPDFRPARKAHTAFLVEGLPVLIARLEQAGCV